MAYFYYYVQVRSVYWSAAQVTGHHCGDVTVILPAVYANPLIAVAARPRITHGRAERTRERSVV